MSDNFHLMQVQYELLGRSPQEIARQNGVSLDVVSYAAEQKGWERKKLADVLLDLNEEEHTEAVINKLALLKEAALLPQYIEVETALLSKLLEMLESIPLGTRVGGQLLEKIAAIFSSLSMSQGMISRVRKPEEAKAGGNDVKIQILNRAS